ncbi:hypothetical protein G3O06_45940 [Burkholderia sp. Ac-20345]|uniref:hypothetical protein n=1 Tax=Burkholderia sp. Ac-20345 TaxID=2703891 RepID=UPI00197B5A13|nr:hypothetical protein [Burkholderia sp. Ac-20345]MBN3784799.1 hypothetical protein [Burkholderia sp. Ac-20345]
MTGAVESTRRLDRSLKSPVLAEERGRSRRSDPDPPVDHLTFERSTKAVLADRSHCLERYDRVHPARRRLGSVITMPVQI